MRYRENMFLNIIVKDFQSYNCPTRTCKDKSDYYHGFKTQLGS